MVSMDGLDPLTLSDGAPERAATKTVVATGYPTSPSVNLGSWEMEPAAADVSCGRDAAGCGREQVKGLIHFSGSGTGVAGPHHASTSVGERPSSACARQSSGG